MVVYEIYTTCFDQSDHSICNNYDIIYYRRNWLLSACAYSHGQQEAMRLIKSMRLTASVCLIERTWALRAGPSTACVTNVKDRHAMESVIRGNHVYKIWQPRLGPSSTLIP